MIKPIAEGTKSLIGGFGTGITMKLGQLKNSESFRSLEEKVGSAYENVLVNEKNEINEKITAGTNFLNNFTSSFQTRVTPSRSNSVQSFDDALREADRNRSKSATNTPATTPTIPE